MADEPLYCPHCGSTDWECGHHGHEEGPDGYCEVGCVLYRGERCRFCADVPPGMTRGEWTVDEHGEPVECPRELGPGGEGA